MSNSEDNLKKEFLNAGKNFFNWNSGKNTPNILLGLAEKLGTVEKQMEESVDKLDAQLGKLDGTIKESSGTSAKLAASLNKITKMYVILTAVIAVATVCQVWLALRSKESISIDRGPLLTTFFGHFGSYENDPCHTWRILHEKRPGFVGGGCLFHVFVAGFRVGFAKYPQFTRFSG